jgi:hypothetical protein
MVGIPQAPGAADAQSGAEKRYANSRLRARGRRLVVPHTLVFQSERYPVGAVNFSHSPAV